MENGSAAPAGAWGSALTDKPLVELRHPDGRLWRVWANGFYDGFPEGTIIINRVPIFEAEAAMRVIERRATVACPSLGRTENWTHLETVQLQPKPPYAVIERPGREPLVVSEPEQLKALVQGRWQPPECP